MRRWTAREGGAERANYQLFLSELCDLIGVDRPNPAGAETARNDYVFERAVRFRHDDGTVSPGRIDLYKKGCFVLEAKQSKKRKEGGEVYEQLAFALGTGHGGGTAILERPRAKAKTKSSLSTWDTLMRSARRQAEDYARALDEWPPFLIVVDVGHVIELYADFSRQGKNYAQFPDRNAFRIGMEDLQLPAIRERLRCVWDDPFSLDPTTHAAEVTQEIAALLAKMTQTMELRVASEEPEVKAEWAFRVSKFLMRCIFAMFAEDIGLLPKGGFLKIIEQHKGNAKFFHVTVEQFFREMDKGVEFSPLIQAKIRKFNGGLFRDAKPVEITEDELTLLEKAARRDWHAVEPAIFGTLLEQALSERERSKLGAHYTPRAYVERLVVPTIIEPLREDWDIVQSASIGKLLEGDEKGAREAVRKFHDTLCSTRVLDPACGTGNFLYVAMELMKRLEGEVLDFLKELGATTEPLRTVDPHQFLGIEVNPRAVPITELVLWIGYIQWWFRTRERQVIAEPILRDFGTVRVGDAVLTYDRQELLKDEHGRPITRQDPHAVKLHPITGEETPDPDAKLPVYRYINPRPAQWPEAEFIVGNPPFIGARRIRGLLGNEYVDALRRAYSTLPRTIDYVMYWWAKAAQLVSDRNARRSGLITTNSIVQDYSRPVLEAFISGEYAKCALAYAVTNHPWVDTEDGAAVRIAMTVVAARVEASRARLGVNMEVNGQEIVADLEVERINSSLRPIPDVLACSPLKSNAFMCLQGVVPAGDGFKIESNDIAGFGKEAVVRPYIIGNDLTEKWGGKHIIDAWGMTEEELRKSCPRSYQRVLSSVLPERLGNRRKVYRDNWWIFAEPRPKLRDAVRNLSKYIGTPYTAVHRVFSFVEKRFVPDAMVYVTPSDDALALGVLSAHIHHVWCMYASGTLEDRPRYNSKRTFYPFPFPSASKEQEARIASLADELDALRKRVLASSGTSAA